jgi:cell division protein FtsA
MNEQIINVIDIGSVKITTLMGLLKKENQEIQIIGVNTSKSKGVKKGLIVDIDQVAESLTECIEKVERMAGRKIDNAFVSVGGPHIASLNSKGVVAISNPNNEISSSDIKRVIDAAKAISLSSTRQVIDVTPRDYIVDGQEGIKNPLGMKGIRLEAEAHIITASQTNLNNIDRCLSLLGINNNGFIFAGLASSEAVLNDTEKELGVVVADIGGGKTDLCIYVEGSLAYSSSLPVGARHITNDIAIGLRVSLDSAEKIKLFLNEYDKRTNKSLKKEDEIDIQHLNLPENLNQISYKMVVDGIINPRLEEIFKLIFDEIEKSGFGNSIPSGLVLCGGGSLTTNIVTIGKRIIGLPIRIGQPSGVTGLVDEILNPAFATAVGLLLIAKKELVARSEKNRFSFVAKDMNISQIITSFKNFFKQFIP